MTLGAIGDLLMAIIGGIAGVVSGIIFGVLGLVDALFGCLTCRDSRWRAERRMKWKTRRMGRRAAGRGF